MRLAVRAGERQLDQCKIDQLMGRGDREGAEDQGVNQCERGGAGTDGESEGRNRGETGNPVLRDHAEAVAEVEDKRLEPYRGLRIPAGFAELERTA